LESRNEFKLWVGRSR